MSQNIYKLSVQLFCQRQDHSYAYSNACLLAVLVTCGYQKGKPFSKSFSRSMNVNVLALQ
jgi:hypothetical protein